MSNPGGPGGLPRLRLPTGASLACGQDIGGGIERARRAEQAPLLQLARAIRPAGGHDDELGTLAGKLLELLGEADVIAGGDTHGELPGIENNERFAGPNGIGFLVLEGVVSVDLFVAAEHSGAGDERDVGHAVNCLLTPLDGIRRGEHSQHHVHAELFCQRAHGGGGGAVESLHVRIEAPGIEALGGSFRQDDKLRAVVRGFPDLIEGCGEVVLNVSGTGQLNCCYLHAAHGRRARTSYPQISGIRGGHPLRR